MVVLRWVAVLPAALLAACLAYALIKLLNGGFAAFDPQYSSSFYFILLEIGCNYVNGFAFVFVGVYVAPSHKKQVALALAVIGILIVGSSLIIQLQDGQWRLVEILSRLACGAGLITCLWQYFEDPRQFKF